MKLQTETGCLLAVAGNPVSHSLSPELFNRFLLRIDSPLIYTRMAADSAERILETAMDLSMCACNVTAPFKEDILPLLSAVDPAARDMKSVNTLVLENGGYTGWNTDYLGVITPFKQRNVPLRGSRCLVVGAGGAARAAVYGLIREGAEVTVVNRTFTRAKRLADRFGCSAEPLERMTQCMEGAEVLIHTIPSEHAFVPESGLHPGLICMDANYFDSELSGTARRRGCTVISGLEWLYFQAFPLMRALCGVPLPEEGFPEEVNGIPPSLTRRDHIVLAVENPENWVPLARAVARGTGFDFRWRPTRPKIPGGKQTVSIVNRIDLQQSISAHAWVVGIRSELDGKDWMAGTDPPPVDIIFPGRGEISVLAEWICSEWRHGRFQ